MSPIFFFFLADDPFSKSDLNCFLSCVYDSRTSGKKKKKDLSWCDTKLSWTSITKKHLKVERKQIKELRKSFLARCFSPTSCQVMNIVDKMLQIRFRKWIP